jgi:hypothetical protein
VVKLSSLENSASKGMHVTNCCPNLAKKEYIFWSFDHWDYPRQEINTVVATCYSLCPTIIALVDFKQEISGARKWPYYPRQKQTETAEGRDTTVTWSVRAVANEHSNASDKVWILPNFRIKPDAPLLLSKTAVRFSLMNRWSPQRCTDYWSAERPSQRKHQRMRLLWEKIWTSQVHI